MRELCDNDELVVARFISWIYSVQGLTYVLPYGPCNVFFSRRSKDAILLELRTPAMSEIT